MTPEIQTFLLAMTPIGELRAAIPIGLIVYQLNPASVYLLAVLGNLLAVFLLFTFLGILSRWTSRNIHFLNRFFGWLSFQTRKNHHNKVNKYGFYLLPFFVAIPLPATGAWTAAFIAFVFGMPFKRSFSLISLGVLIAGLIVLFLTQTGITIERNFGWQILVAIIFISGIIYWLYKKQIIK